MRDFHRSWIAREFGLRHYLPLEERDLDALQAAGETLDYEADAPLFRQGNTADAAFLIRSGTVGLWRDHRRPTVHLATVGEGRVIGDLEMFTDEQYFSTAIAAPPSVTALRMPRDETMALLAEHPRLTLRWLVAALRQFEESQQRISQLLVKSAEARIALYLLDEMDDQGEVAITHAQAARLLGLERATVSRSLGSMRERGLVESGRGSIRVVDMQGLVTVANGAWPDH